MLTLITFYMELTHLGSENSRYLLTLAFRWWAQLLYHYIYFIICTIYNDTVVHGLKRRQLKKYLLFDKTFCWYSSKFANNSLKKRFINFRFSIIFLRDVGQSNINTMQIEKQLNYFVMRDKLSLYSRIQIF